MSLKRFVTVTLGSALLIGLSWSAITRIQDVRERREKVLEQTEVERPPVQERPVVTQSSSVSSAEASEAPPETPSAGAVNWNVPFTSQAPHGEWDAVHKEACEEASILMVLRFFRDEPITSPDDAERGLQEVLAKNEEFGYAIDTTAAEVANVVRSMQPDLDVALLHDPTIDDLKQALRDGALIIVPAQGQWLGNPYFQTPGPRYHMLVLRGFTDDGYVITNDPGTRRGEAFVYTWDVLLNAIHDWNGGEVESGAKVVVVVRSA